MALRITTTAAETLNDIILHKLQQDGLEKTESFEQQLFDQITSLPDADSSENVETKIILPGGDYAFVYQHNAESKLLLAIVHHSRLPKSAIL